MREVNNDGLGDVRWRNDMVGGVRQQVFLCYLWRCH